MEICILQESDAKLYQALRLNALQTNPEAFGSTYEREAAFPLETVAERLKPSQDKFVLGAFSNSGALVGIVTFMRETSPKFRHKGNIFGMYVAPEGRGHGLGKSLILELIRKAGQLEGLEQINLTVVSDNTAAKHVYRSVGFETYGVEQHALKHNGQYLDEDLMVLRV